MQQHGQRRGIDEPVQALPALRAEPAHRAIEGCGGQGQQQQKRQGADQDERSLDDVAHDVRSVQAHIEHRIAQQMHAGIKEGEQPEHAPPTRHR